MPCEDNNIIYRKATHLDREAIHDIRDDVYGGYDYLNTNFHIYQHDPDYIQAVAVDGTKIVAYALIRVTNLIRYIKMDYIYYILAMVQFLFFKML